MCRVHLNRPICRGLVVSAVILLLVLLGVGVQPPGAVAAAVNERWVSVSGSDAAAGTQAAPWRHIQYALDHTPPTAPGLIHVGPGTYQEQVYITRAVTIRGSQTSEVIVENPVDSTYTYPGGLPDVGDPSFVVRAEGAFDVTLSDLTVNGRHSFSTGTPGIKAVQAGLTLQRVDVLIPDRVGIVLKDLDQSGRTFRIEESSIKTKVAAGSFGTDLGIQVIESSGVISHFTGGTEIDHVIHIAGGHDVLIEHSTIHGSTVVYWADGIRAWSGNVRIVDTTIVRPNKGPFGDAVLPPANDPVYAPQQPYAGIEAVNHGGVGVSALHLSIDGCRVQGFDEALGIYVRGQTTSGPQPRANTIKVQNSWLTGRVADVATRWQASWTDQPAVDLGGGSLGSVGNNDLGRRQIVLPGSPFPSPFPSEPKPWGFYHRAPYDVTAYNNAWTIPVDKIDERIWDRLDQHGLGRVKY